MSDDAAVRAAEKALESVWGLVDDPEGFAITAVDAARPLIEAGAFRKIAGLISDVESGDVSRWLREEADQLEGCHVCRQNPILCSAHRPRQGTASPATAAVSAMTGLSPERLNELGGVPEDESH